MVNRIPSEMTPRKLANSMLRRLEKSPDVTVSVWRQPRIEEERLGGLLGVARGSAEEPRLVIATYDPDAASKEVDGSSAPEGTSRWSRQEVTGDAATPAHRPHIVLVGKGVTFDSGGLSLKTATGMTTMKTDMTGAAVVLAALTVCGELGVTAKVTAIAPMTENMPGGAAMKPGDVLTARDGTTIEVLNTDAEGRLILADALALAVELEPDAIIDVATLTGAAVVALGGSVAALMSNNQELADDLLAAASTAGEPLWQLPLFADYESQLDSEIADLKNIGSPGQAGSITAGLFLQRFVGEVPWAHLDIAGPSRAEKTEGYIIKGGTAFSLRTLLAFLRAASLA
jgi:leucyl aminopeptidase